MSRKRRFAAAVSLAAVASMLAAMPFGAGAESFTYEPVQGADFSFNKYLVVDENATVPKATFTYTIEPAGIETKHLTGTDVELYNGAAGAVMKTTDPDAQFTSESTTSTDAAGFTDNKGASASINVLGDMDGKKYATDSVTVDVSACDFTEPGVYRYTLTESDVTAPFQMLTEKVRTLDVYVQDKGTGTAGELEVTGYVLYDKDMAAVAPTNYSETDAETGIGYNTNENDTASGKKSSGFVNGYETVDLTVTKAVTGNQGSKDKYFKFTITSNTTLEATDKFYLTGSFEAAPTATAATKYDTAEMAVTANSAVADGESYYVTGETLNAGYVIYMQANQDVTINGLPEGVSYTVTEDPEDYTPTAAISAGDTKTGDASEEGTAIALDGSAMSDTFMKEDTTIDYTNNRQGTIPTGILLSIAAPALIGVIVLGAIIFLVVKGKRRSTEED